MLIHFPTWGGGDILYQSRTFSEELDLLKDNGMSIALRQQIAIYLFKDYLQKIPFFQLATDNVLGMICMQLHPVIYMPEDYIIHEGDIGKELFMIVKGIVRVMPPKDSADPAAEKKILLGEGDFFGEIGVIMEVERTRSVRAECMAELCILSRDGFDKILVEFPEFATAMKKLIIKRVGEMWQFDANDTDRMEKMTKLADSKMKRTVQTYNNVQKLRGSAHIIHAFRSKAPQGEATLTTVPVTESSGVPGKEPREATRSLESFSLLEPITELESEPESLAFERKSTLENMMEDISAADTATIKERLASEKSETPTGSAHTESSPEAEDSLPPEVESHAQQLSSAAAVAEPKAAATQKVFRKFEKALHQMEKKMETRLGDLDAKIAQLLQVLTTPSTSQTNSSGARDSMTNSCVDAIMEVAAETHLRNADLD